WFYNAGEGGSQALLLGFPKGGVERAPNYRLVVDMNAGSTIELTIPSPAGGEATATCEVKPISGAAPEYSWNCADDGNLVLTIAAGGAPCAAEFSNFVYTATAPLSLEPTRKVQGLDPIETSPDFRPALENALVEWDWAMQDGVGTEREPRTYAQALELRLPQGRALLDDLTAALDEGAFDNLTAYDVNLEANLDSFAPKLAEYEKAWNDFEKRFEAVKTTNDDEAARELWREMRTKKREILLSSPLFQFDKMLFFKHAPGVMSHQLTQVYGYCARPGGGIYLLEKPGKSMKTRAITPKNLPLGSYMTPELTFDGKDLYFAYCETPTTPNTWRAPDVMDRRFHLYKMPVDGGDAARLTDGDFDDFAPLCLPDGDLIFSSTRRGGFHRCGGGPCYVYTLARCGGDGSEPHSISFHETNEWFPTLMRDGRVVYTRWDYVDR
ncbi:MAG: hypothetical protein HUK22_04605, partial [Thermoguttaceae bacterium]|nr:hypothetical protein [Thermoguttaceae bacterium]